MPVLLVGILMIVSGREAGLLMNERKRIAVVRVMDLRGRQKTRRASGWLGVATTTLQRRAKKVEMPVLLVMIVRKEARRQGRVVEAGLVIHEWKRITVVRVMALRHH
jgi:hypothetical protein